MPDGPYIYVRMAQPFEAAPVLSTGMATAGDQSESACFFCHAERSKRKLQGRSQHKASFLRLRRPDSRVQAIPEPLRKGLALNLQLCPLNQPRVAGAQESWPMSLEQIAPEQGYFALQALGLSSAFGLRSLKKWGAAEHANQPQRPSHTKNGTALTPASQPDGPYIHVRMAQPFEAAPVLSTGMAAARAQSESACFFCHAEGSKQKLQGCSQHKASFLRLRRLDSRVQAIPGPLRKGFSLNPQR